MLAILEMPSWLDKFLPILILLVAISVVVRRLPKVDLGHSPALVARLFALTQPALMAVVLVTALQSAGQFTLFSYFAPYYRQTLAATPAQISLLFFWFGLFGLVVLTIGAVNATALALVAPAPVLWLLHAAWQRSITWRTAVVTAVKLGSISIVVSL